MEIYLIRHTAPDIDKGVCYGHYDVPLKDTFKEEAEIVFRNLPKNIEIIYSSPLIRCLKLALYLSEKLVVPIKVDSRLMELNFGEWESKKWDEIDPLQLQNWMNGYEHVRCPNGESYKDLAKRTNSFLRHVALTDKSKLVAIVTHLG